MELILLGIDGAEPSVVRHWANKGVLPNFARFLKTGAFGKCRSSIHPLTPQAWTSIITGVGAGVHGIYDFGQREPNSYNMRLVTSKDRAAPAFWEILAGKKSVGVVNVPLSYPPDPVDGFFISGMHTPKLSLGVYPPGLEKELEGYVIDVMCHWYKNTGDFLADVIEMCDQRHRLVLELAEKYNPDILFPVYIAADRIQHALWGKFTKKHLERPGWCRDDGDAIFRIYKQMDDILGDYMEIADETGASLMIISDHGFGDLKRDVYLNALLAKNGLLAFDPKKIRAYTPIENPKAQDPTHDWQRDAFPDGPVEFGSDEDLKLGNVDPRYKTFDTVDWEKTKAYCAGLFGNIWVNLKGREPKGIVTEEQYENVRDRVIALLKELKDPEDNQPVADKVFKREELFTGPMAHLAPDILVQMRDYAYITRGSTEFLCNTVIGKVAVNHTGNHRLFGIIGLYGKHVRKGIELTGATVLDVAPSLLYLLGAPIPQGLEGKPLLSALSPEFRNAHPVQYGKPSAKREIGPDFLSDQEKKIIKERLRTLGYLG